MSNPHLILVFVVLLVPAATTVLMYFVNRAALPSTAKERSLATVAVIGWLASLVIANFSTTPLVFPVMSGSFTLSVFALWLGSSRAGDPSYVVALRERVLRDREQKKASRTGDPGDGRR